jgi:DNA modification methylase
MILTDPPYGMNLIPQRECGKFHNVKIHNDDNLEWADVFFSECFRVIKKDSIMYSFCSYHSVGKFIECAKKYGFIVKNLLVWDKMWFGIGNNWRPNFELILVLGNGRFVTKSKNKSNILSYRRISPQKSVHPTEKVIPLLEELIAEPDYSPQIILDPFAGSGTTGVACKNLNRNYILIEKEPEYIEIIKKRLNIN